MSGSNVELANNWIKKAEHDLVSARQILKLNDGPTDTVCFHAQQTIEKAIKAFLTFKSINFTKIHDLVRLLEIAKPHYADIEDYRDKFEEINSYAVDVRYPDFLEDPTREEASQAVLIAEEVLNKLKELIPEE